ncbi:MAG: MaoC family dehydratase N-terminal domain-containing protein, partial [Dehalococcoidia bacterium]|nr:MaoC family dehydratase N-terminal domain-containing protein [Dehalococcoidia bacterium]
LYLDEEAAKAGPYGTIIAPPLFYNMLSLQPGLDPRVKFGTSGFDAGQHAEFFEPIRAGDTISAKTQVADVYAKTGRTGAMVF